MICPMCKKEQKHHEYFCTRCGTPTKIKIDTSKYKESKMSCETIEYEILTDEKFRIKALEAEIKRLKNESK